MGKTMSPSNTITRGQAGKLADMCVAQLIKSTLQSEQTQEVLERHGAVLADAFVELVRARVEVLCSTIVRHSIVNRTRSGHEALKATGRALYCNDGVVKTMPNGIGEEVEVHFFKIGKYVNDTTADEEYALRGLIPADPYALAAINEADPAFADEHPNCTHWKDKGGKWCCAAFLRWLDDVRYVSVNQGVSGWCGHWWFAGVRK